MFKRKSPASGQRRKAVYKAVKYGGYDTCFRAAEKNRSRDEKANV